MLWSTSKHTQRITLRVEATVPFSGRPTYVVDSEQIPYRWRD